MTQVCDAVVAQLRSFYQNEHIAVAAFACPHQSFCDNVAMPRPLAHGAEAHVGSHYGETTRVVVISLDAGGDSEDLSARRDTIESITNPNPHMRGTIRILNALLGSDLNGQSPLPFYSMINAAKCSAVDRRDMVPWELYERCCRFARSELEILEPQVVVTQGVQARQVLPSERQHIPPSWLDTVLQRLPAQSPPIRSWLIALGKEYLRTCQVGATTAITLEVPHPSARGGQWQLFDRVSLEPLSWLVRQLLSCTSTERA